MAKTCFSFEEKKKFLEDLVQVIAEFVPLKRIELVEAENVNSDTLAVGRILVGGPDQTKIILRASAFLGDSIYGKVEASFEDPGLKKELPWMFCDSLVRLDEGIVGKNIRDLVEGVDRILLLRELARDSTCCIEDHYGVDDPDLLARTHWCAVGALLARAGRDEGMEVTESVGHETLETTLVGTVDQGLRFLWQARRYGICRIDAFGAKDEAGQNYFDAAMAVFGRPVVAYDVEEL